LVVIFSLHWIIDIKRREIIWKRKKLYFLLTESNSQKDAEKYVAINDSSGILRFYFLMGCYTLELSSSHSHGE